MVLMNTGGMDLLFGIWEVRNGSYEYGRYRMVLMNTGVMEVPYYGNMGDMEWPPSAVLLINMGDVERPPSAVLLMSTGGLGWVP